MRDNLLKFAFKENGMVNKGEDGKNIRVGDIAIHQFGQKDERALRVDFSKDGTVSGTLLKRSPGLCYISDDSTKFTKVPLNKIDKQDILNKAYLDDITKRKNFSGKKERNV